MAGYDPTVELSLLRRTDNGPKPEDGSQADVPFGPIPLDHVREEPLVDARTGIVRAAPGLTAKNVLLVAQSQLGQHEDAQGRTKYGKWYGQRVKDAGFETAAWCDMFAAWCANQVAGDTALEATGCFAYTPWHAQWFADRGRFDRKLEVGAYAFYSWSQSRNISDIDHVETIEKIFDDGTFYAIGGNVSNAVKRTRRSKAYLVGVGHWSKAAVINDDAIEVVSLGYAA